MTRSSDLRLPRRIGGKVRSVLMNGALLLVSVVVSLALFEGALRVFSPLEMRIKGDKILLAPFHRIIMDGSGQPKFDKEIVQSRNNLGLRGENPPAKFEDAITLIAMGGSTTEGYYLSDGKTWPEQLSFRLSDNFKDVWVNNAGMDGQTSFGHLALFRQHIRDIHPDYILVMAGINDHALSQANLYDGNVRPAPPPEARQWTLKEYLGRNSEAFALLLTMYRSWTAAKVGLGHGNINFSSAGNGRPIDPGTKDRVLAVHRRFLGGFRERIETLARDARASGIEPILVTQTAMWGDGKDPSTGLEIGNWITGTETLADGSKVVVNGSVAWAVLDSYNDVLRAVAEAQGLMLVDLGQEMTKDSKYFYDWYHFANAGAAEAARIIARDLCPFLRKRHADQFSGECPG